MMARVRRILALLSAPLVLAGSFGCSGNKQNLLPSQLAGFWTTNAPKYHGRFLELNRAFVIIGSGPDNPPSVQIVDSVTIHPEQQDLSLTIYSSDVETGQNELTLQFSPANGGEIRFPHQSEVWTRYVETRENGAGVR